MDKQVFNHLQEIRVPPHVLMTWEDKYLHSKCPRLLLLSPVLHAEHDTVWYGRKNNILCPFGIGCPSCAPPACSLVGWSERQKSSWLCVSATQQQLKHPCAINTLFITNSKHKTIQVPRKKNNSIPAKISASPLDYKYVLQSLNWKTEK